MEVPSSRRASSSSINYKHTNKQSENIMKVLGGCCKQYVFALTLDINVGGGDLGGYIQTGFM